MDMQLVGIAYVFSPLRSKTVATPATEDAYYAAYDSWVPGWLSRLVAALRALRRPAEQPASIRDTQLA